VGILSDSIDLRGHAENVEGTTAGVDMKEPRCDRKPVRSPDARSRGADVFALGLDERLAARASAHAMAINFATLKCRVLAVLEPQDQARFDSSSAWDTMVLELADALQGGRW
jgi:hypothetical protein